MEGAATSVKPGHGGGPQGPETGPFPEPTLSAPPLRFHTVVLVLMAEFQIWLLKCPFPKCWSVNLCEKREEAPRQYPAHSAALRKQPGLAEMGGRSGEVEREQVSCNSEPLPELQGW